MSKHAFPRLTLALALAVMAFPSAKVFAQSSIVPITDGVTGTDPEPQGPDGVTGTDPEPQGPDVETILDALELK